MAPETGFEPVTNWLTANCSTTELLGIVVGDCTSSQNLDSARLRGALLDELRLSKPAEYRNIP